jgi:teichuronic acid biosynthesis glycosyltransferase TuaH
MLNFVIISLARWNVEFGCNIRDISYELAKHHKVLYVDVPLKRKERLFKKKTEQVIEVQKRITEGTNLIKLSDNLWHYIDFSVLESVNSIENNFLFDAINKINNKKLAKVLKRAIKLVGFEDYILINDNDIYNGLHLKKYLNPSLYVYYLRDRLPAMIYWKKHSTRLEPLLIKEVDLVLTNSEYFSNYASVYNTNSFNIGQGCDIEHFSSRPEQSEINSIRDTINNPIIGYIGALNSERLDIKLLIELAKRLPDYYFIFVGWEDEVFANSNLHKMKNVRFTGKKDFSELPKYLYSFNVAINPQLLNEITIGNYPRKIDEYLASGIPVVATNTLLMQPFADHVYLADTTDDYVRLIKKALAEDSLEKQRARREFANSHNWKNNVDLMLKYISSNSK